MPDTIYPFHLGVLAPIGFRTPGLEQSVTLATGSVLSRRIQRQPITLFTVIGEPVCLVAGEVCKLRRWGHTNFAKPATARRVFAEIASLVDGLLILHGGSLPADLQWVERELCPWLKVPVRVMAVAG